MFEAPVPHDTHEAQDQNPNGGAFASYLSRTLRDRLGDRFFTTTLPQLAGESGIPEHAWRGWLKSTIPSKGYRAQLATYLGVEIGTLDFAIRLATRSDDGTAIPAK